MVRSFKIITFLSLFLSCHSFAQEPVKDTSVIIRSYAIDPQSNIPYPSDFDTTMRVVHEYNPIYYNSFSQTFLGNTGQASITNNLDKREVNVPFMFSIPYKYYIYTPYNIHHFNTQKPFTEIKYATSGSRDDSEQVLSALHTQNIDPFTNAGIFYDLIASKGIYNDQNTGLNRIVLFGNHSSNAYSMNTSMHYNGFKFRENGGIKDLEEFRNRGSEALNYSTNLDDANSRFRNMNFYFTHKLGLAVFFSDSATKEKFNTVFLRHTFDYNRFSRIYSDFTNRADSLSFYENNFYLTDEITDSAFYHNLSNRLDLNIKLAGTQNLLAYIKHEYKKFSYVLPAEVSYEAGGETVDTVIKTYPRESFNDLSVGGIYTGDLKNWEYSASGQFFLSGYRSGDLITRGEFTRYFKDRSSFLTMGGLLSSRKPSFFYNEYGSAHLEWNNDFKNIDNIKGFARIGNENNFQMKLSLDYFTGYVFFNTEAMPEQVEREIFTASLKIDKKFVWGPVNHVHNVLLQKGAEGIINVPLLAYRNATWYENEIFNDVLKLRIGAELYFFSSYFADAYMPATSMFYTQKKQKTGNYPFTTAFVDVKLKRTRFSIQYTNALSELITTADYFMAFGHPNFNNRVRFSLAWTFYD